MATDGSIQFPPGQRRDKPSFEPPPWERDQFEELAKRRQDAEPVQDLEIAGVTQPASDLAEADEFTVPVSGESAQDSPSDAEQQAEPEKPALDPKHVEALMLGLRAEEPRLEEAYWRITVAAGVLSVFIGLVITTWGVVGLASPNKAGASTLVMVSMMLLFGVGFVAAGVWVVIRSLRQQGVL